MRDSFKDYCANPNNPKWENMIKREKELYSRKEDIRSEFERDHNRIINTTGYRRMKHKTQVFFSPTNDHICTRIEHVTHVESISYTIANYLGLNTELTKAIATAHDIGHSPFGHAGERILSEISLRDIGETFWHEKNGVDMVDKIELLADNKGNKQNLNLTYAVRDGIISHCGEIDENSLKPRDEFVNLDEYTYPNQFNPYTWEGCVVKISDKISYIGRDLEDALHLGLLDAQKINELKSILGIKSEETLNNPNIINDLIIDICNNSSIEKGLCFSEEKLNLLNRVKEYNCKNIYLHPRLDGSNEYFRVIINRIYNTLKSLYSIDDLNGNILRMERFYPETVNSFKDWIYKYSNYIDRTGTNLKNKIVYNIEDEKEFSKCIIDFIAGMTDNFAIDMYNEIIGF